MLVSESDIPLYDPLTLHQQLMAETKSRVNLCRNSISDVRRWSWRMAVSGNWQQGGTYWRRFGVLSTAAAAWLLLLTLPHQPSAVIAPPPPPQAPHLRPAHWRKSSQWFGMLREHARVVLEDVEVFRR